MIPLEIDVPLPFVEGEVVRPSPLALSDSYETPPPLFAQLHHEFHFTLDAAASAENTCCPDHFYTPAEDGLRQDWSGERVWLNPPYGRGQIPRWLRKVREEQARGVLTVCLLPSLTDTRWFHNLCAPHAELRFLRGRVTFFHQGAHLSTARFASLVAVYRPTPTPVNWISR